MKSGIISSTHKILELIEFIRSKSEFAFDTETDGLSYDRRWIGFSLSVLHNGEYLGWYLPIAHEQGDDLFSISPTNLDKTHAHKLIQIVFSEDKTVWIQNAKFDLGVLRNEGFDIQEMGARILDTRCASWLLEPEREGGHGLKNLVPKILGFEMGSFSQFKHYTKNSYVPIGEMGKYAIEDSVFLLQLAHNLYPQLSSSLLKVFHELEMPIMLIVEEMEYFGFRVDVDQLNLLYKELTQEAHHLESKFKALFGTNAQINSPQWLSKNMDKVWGDQVNQGTGKDKLKHILENTKISALGQESIELVLRYRQVSKLASTYCKALVDAADANQRVHGSFNPWGTGTGRWSSSSPNLQNIPSSRTKEGDIIRKAFKAQEGYRLIVADYSQIELRVMAHLSNDPTMSGIYQNAGDIHQMTADACGCSRFDAKAVNFGLIYKMGAKTLAEKINTTEAEAQEYSDKYFERYVGVVQHQERLISACRRKGFTWTITGRRRPLKNINSSNFRLRASDERKAINTQVQGSAADLLKIGMRNFYQRLRGEGLSPDIFRIVGQVHDEVIIEVLNEHAEYVCSVLQHEMENCVQLDVPLIAEPCIADSWGEAK